MIKNDIPGFDDESNKINLDVIQMIALLECCILILNFVHTSNTANWNRKYMLSSFISGNNFENNR